MSDTSSFLYHDVTMILAASQRGRSAPRDADYFHTYDLAVDGSKNALMMFLRGPSESGTLARRDLDANELD